MGIRKLQQERADGVDSLGRIDAGLFERCPPPLKNCVVRRIISDGQIKWHVTADSLRHGFGCGG